MFDPLYMPVFVIGNERVPRGTPLVGYDPTTNGPLTVEAYHRLMYLDLAGLQAGFPKVVVADKPLSFR